MKCNYWANKSHEVENAKDMSYIAAFIKNYLKTGVYIPIKVRRKCKMIRNEDRLFRNE